jgi:hypothetical protein
MGISNFVLIVLGIACIGIVVFILKRVGMTSASQTKSATGNEDESASGKPLADIMAISDSDWEVLGEFGDFVGSLENRVVERLVYPDSILPRPKKDIEAAFARALSQVKSNAMRSMLEDNRAMLACFVARDALPKDLEGDLEYLGRVWANNPGGKRLFAGAMVRAMTRTKGQQNA